MAKERSHSSKLAIRAKKLLGYAFDDYRGKCFKIELWDKSQWSIGIGDPCFTMRINHPSAIRSMFLRPSTLTLGEAFIRKDIEIDEDLEGAAALAEYFFSKKVGFFKCVKFTGLALLLPKQSTQISAPAMRNYRLKLFKPHQRLRAAIQFHYDMPTDVWKSILDTRLVYSCGYYETKYDTLEKSQLQKLDYVCKKLELNQNDRILDLGCGWGGLLEHAARDYGAKVVGITLSPSQAEYVNGLIRRKGLKGKCEVRIQSYEDLVRREKFDAIASIGAIEHVSKGKLPDYFSTIWELLRVGGRFLNQGIAYSPAYPRPKRPSFFNRYVFPDGHLETLGNTVEVAQRIGFEVSDIENLRIHYAYTLRNWLERLETNSEVITKTIGCSSFRVLQLYFAAAANDFAFGRNNVFQCLFHKANSCDHPRLTRESWYQSRSQA